MEVIRFKSVGDMSGGEVLRSHYHFSPVESRDLDADWSQHKARDHAPAKWASCKLLGFRPEADNSDQDGQEEVAGGEHRFKSTGDFLAGQRESCPLEEEEDTNWMLMLASLAEKKPAREKEDGGARRATAKWRASGARRRKVAKLARLALSSPSLGQRPARRQQPRQDSGTAEGQEQQRVEENNGQLGGVGVMIVVADREGATRSSQPMETGHPEQAPANDSQQAQQVTGDAQHNAAGKRQQQQTGDNGNDFAFGSLAFDRDRDSAQVTGRGVGFATAAAALTLSQSQTQVRLGIGAVGEAQVGEAQIGENANACAPSPATTTLKATGKILPISHSARQQQLQSSAAAAADVVDYATACGSGEAQAQSRQQVSHARQSHEHRQRRRQHHSSHKSRRQEREQRKVDGGGVEGERMGERNLAAAADSGSIVVEMSGQHWLRGALVGHQLAEADKPGDNGLVASSASTGKLAELHFGAAANRLVGSLCSAGQTWRQALQPPSHSGTYEVAQREQQAAFAISGCHVEVGGNSSKPEVEFAGTTGGQQQQQQETLTTGRHVKRHPRPGRSPISLQRQTNARLAKHRAKIQQQRQEQLALLALSQRQQLGGHQFSGGQEGGMPISENQQHSNIYIINDRLPTSSSCHQQYRSSSSRPSTSAQAFEQQLQQQVISPTTSTAIEICDNQLACTSSGSGGRSHHSSRGFNLSRHPTSTERTNVGNVIVYKSINMFRNNPLSGDSSKGIDKDQDDTMTISSSSSTLSLNRPFCKICHMGSSRTGDKLISPCKCSGTMQYIHCGCLLKWLEISNRTNEKPMSCELCAHEYSWHKMFNYKHLRWPKCSLKDIFLHFVFVLALAVMIYSAIAPILQRKSQDNIATSSTSKSSSSANSGRERQQLVGSQFYHASLGGRSNHFASSSLASDEKLMLLCAASFFISFFLAIYVQTKARDTLYGLFVKFLNLNQTYYITEYDHGNSTANKQLLQQQQQQLQQQQQHAASCPRNYRKSGQEELINS